MKPTLVIVLLLTSPFALDLTPLPAGEVAPGDDREAVFAALGEPQGRIGSDDFQILHFKRGEVHLRNGVVERADLVSEEEAEAQRLEREKRREERKREREERRRAREREREDRIAEGETLRDEKLADESFAERPPRERVAFWQTFRRHYPEVDVSFQLEVARAERQEEERIRREEEQREERLIALQRRIRDAEARAAEAEAKAREAEEETRRNRYRRTIVHTVPTHIVWPHHTKPHKDPGDPEEQNGPRKRRVLGEPERELTAFERAREYRLERSQQRSELRRHSLPAPIDGNREVRGVPEREPSAFERARDRRFERSQQSSELRRRSS